MTDQAILAALTRWGEVGHTVTLRFGISMHGTDVRYGWYCTIGAWSQGSVMIGYDKSADGYHPKSLIEAVRMALKAAPDVHPMTARTLQDLGE